MNQLRHILHRMPVVTLCLFFLTCTLTPDPGLAKHVSTSHYAGYSKAFQPYKKSLRAGNLKDVLKQMDQEEQELRANNKDDFEFAEAMGLLGLFERTSLALQAGNISKSIFYSKMAEDLIEARESESYFNTGIASVGSMFAEAAGNGESGRYDAAGFEKVLLLNIQAMNLLLEGSESALNVTRKAIELQDEERDNFYIELEASKKEHDENSGSETQQDKNSVFTAINKAFIQFDDEAVKVSSAFVNPFGDFLSGVVFEFKSANSVKDQSLLDNAKICYKNALELNPDSKTLQLAVKQTTQKLSAANLIQIVAFDGFAPEKKVLPLAIPVAGLSAPLKVELPVYTPIPSKVKKIVVSTADGKKLATLSPLASITSLAMRHQKEQLPLIKALVVSSTLRDALIKEVGNSFFGGFGSLVGSAIDSAMEPNTSSWMSLPSDILGGRLHAPKGLKKIKITTYDNKGKKLAQKVVNLSKGARHFVFVRSIDNSLTIYPGKTIWTHKK